MSWTFWDTKRLQEANYRTAETFLRTGYRLCFDSDQCASGYACIGARCELQNNENSNDGSCAGTTSTSYSEASNCPSGGSAGCTNTGCSSNADCPCGRCCRYDAYGNVTCYCGICLKYDGERCSSDKECLSGKCIGGFCGGGYCDIFCDIFYQNTNSYLPGCSRDNVCDECSECTLANTCTKRPGAPCWCGSCPTGQYCEKNGLCTDIPNPGICRDKTKCNQPTGQKCCKTFTGWQSDPTHCPDQTLLNEPCPPEEPACNTYTVYVGGQADPNWSPPCKPNCQCTYNGYITANNLTAYLYTECCGGDECDCTKNPTTCDSQCGECKKCNSNKKCVNTTETCPPLTLPPSTTNDTCFKGYYGYGCFTNVTFIDYDCCYFSNYRPDGGWTGTYIGGGQVRVTSCSGAFCDVPVGGIRPVWGNIGTILSNSQSGIVNCGCCNCSGTSVSVTYS